MLHQTFLLLGQLWQLFEVSQFLEFFTVSAKKQVTKFKSAKLKKKKKKKNI